MDTFTAQELADFYQKVADGGEIEYLYEGAHKFMIKAGPDLSGYLEHWRIKPTKKVIDLSALINGIDCEFNEALSFRESYNVISKLSSIQEGPVFIATRSPSHFPFCRPRMNHKHAWGKGKLPLPEGFEVKVWIRNGTIINTINLNNLIYCDDPSYDIIAFEVLRVADGYVMPYDKEQEPCHAKQSQ
jgi:hypothetical protein